MQQTIGLTHYLLHNFSNFSPLSVMLTSEWPRHTTQFSKNGKKIAA